MDEKDTEQEITDSAMFRESIHKVLLDMEEKLSFNVDTPSDKSLNNSSINLGEGSQSNDSEIKAKLPKINLRPFSGDPINFQPFFDSFKSAIDDNKKLSSIDKINYLCSLLKGAAAAAIQGLPLTSENYEAAKAILNKRYGNKQTIINAHMEGLVKIPTMIPYDGLKQFRQCLIASTTIYIPSSLWE